MIQARLMVILVMLQIHAGACASFNHVKAVIKSWPSLPVSNNLR